MQYLLSENEYYKLVNAEILAKENVTSVIQDLCTRVADSELTTCSWDDTGERVVIGCVMSQNPEGYCGDCVVREQCPNKHKQYSK